VLNQVIGELLEGHPVSAVKLKEVLGHTPLQVRRAWGVGRGGGGGVQLGTGYCRSCQICLVSWPCCERPWTVASVPLEPLLMLADNN
jgi:hypothetical protein